MTNQLKTSRAAEVFSLSDTASGHPEEIYGKQLEEVGTLGCGRCMDAFVNDDMLYVIGNKKLRIYDISTPAKPQKVSEIDSLGNVRQITVSDSIAYVTSRSDGLFIIDVKDPAKPKLLHHFDTLEMATGIWVTGKIAMVALRTYGVQLIDVSNPQKPLHLSTVRTGEAQSLVARDGYAYVGVWGSCELVICDIRNPRAPKIVSKTRLDGFGDGVWVRGKYCFISTGHHRPGRKTKREDDPCYGHGHGMEVYDITNPAKPKLVSRLKTPRFYRIGMDMWDVAVAGKYAYMGDTHNGFFIADISDISKPKFVAHKQLPYIKKRKDCSPVGGFATTKDYVYVAGAWTDLHILAAPGLAKPVETDVDTPPTIPPFKPEKLKGFRIYKPDGQVYAVAFLGNTAYVAAGSDGIHAVELWPEIKVIAKYPAEGFVCDIKIRGNTLYASEGLAGASIWKIGKDRKLSRQGRYRSRGRSLKQIVIPKKGKYLLAESGGSRFQAIDVSDPTAPKKVFEDHYLGLLYGYQIADGLFEDRYACCFWHVTGYHWFDLLGGKTIKHSGDNFKERTGAENGMAMLPGGKEALCTLQDGRYFILSRAEKRPLKELPKYGVKGKKLRGGKPSIYGNTLYVSNRFHGTVNVIDITDIYKPELIKKYTLKGNPGFVVEHNNCIVIPAGYQGLLITEK